jgi:putative ABC transport system ATP-binding protein
MVTHDSSISGWADRVVFLRDGRLVDTAGPLPGPEVLLAPEVG